MSIKIEPPRQITVEELVKSSRHGLDPVRLAHFLRFLARVAPLAVNCENMHLEDQADLRAWLRDLAEEVTKYS